MAETKSAVGRKAAVCGNVDVKTVLLFGDSEDVREAVKSCIDKGTDILTTSCGIPPLATTENLKTLVETAKT